MVKAKLAGMPKRPMSAYFLWMNDVGRAEVKKANPSASITEVSKECGAAWQNIDPAVKAKYEKKKDEAKKAFDKNYAAWLADGGEELQLLWYIIHQQLLALWRCSRLRESQRSQRFPRRPGGEIERGVSKHKCQS